MKISLFSESLFALSLPEAVEATARIGFEAIELACRPPHFDLDKAQQDPAGVANQIQDNGLQVSALSLYNCLTDRDGLQDQIDAAGTYIRLAPLFGTAIVKMTPGQPSWAAAGEEHWHCLGLALEQLVPLAEEVGVKLAFETHMRQLTDTLAGANRLLQMAPCGVVGLTVDFSNLAFAGEKMCDVIPAVAGRIYNTHVKNGTIGGDGSWNFHALDTGLVNYQEVLPMLQAMQYDGYLTLECLGVEAKEHPRETAARDLEVLRRYLRSMSHF